MRCHVTNTCSVHANGSSVQGTRGEATTSGGIGLSISIINHARSPAALVNCVLVVSLASLADSMPSIAVCFLVCAVAVFSCVLVRKLAGACSCHAGSTPRRKRCVHEGPSPCSKYVSTLSALLMHINSMRRASNFVV